MHMMTPKPSSYYSGLGKSSFANPLYLKKAQKERRFLYNVKYDKNDLANLFALEPDEIIRLAKESRSKLCKKTIVESDWKDRVQNKWQNPITHDVKSLVKDMLIVDSNEQILNSLA
ncbi:hypothetical protein Tco_0157932 [Tanacetum coccineum]